MVLTTTRIDAVTPRGARPGVDVVLDGVGFGVAAGSVVFDPLGENLTATVVTWGPTQVDVTVPALTQGDLFVDVLLTRQDGTDQATTKFWVPSVDLSGPYGLPAGLGYQLPNAEAGGPNESADSPTLQQAADINRILDRVVGQTGLARQETFTGETTTLGVAKELDLELAEVPVSAEAVQLFLRRDPGGAGDTQGGLLRVQGTDYSVDVQAKKATWLASADVALAAVDLLTIVYTSRGIA